jgi:flagellar motility protein MotE (MotC chaperone)
MFKYDSSEQPFMEEAMRLAKAEELMAQIEARAEALQERLEKHGTHDQEDHGGKNKRPRPMPTKPAPTKPSPKPENSEPVRPKKPKPEMQIPERPKDSDNQEAAQERLQQEIEEKKKKDEALRRKLQEQIEQAKKKG